MVPAIILFLLVAMALRSIRKTIFFFRMIKKGLIAPNQNDFRKINEMLKNRRHHPFFRILFKEILFLQIKIFLKKSKKKEKFITSIIFILKSVNRFPLDKDRLNLRIGKILDQHDKFLSTKISGYKNHVPVLIVRLIGSISELRKYNQDFLHLSFWAIENKLITLIGQPLVQKELHKFTLDYITFNKVKDVFDSQSSAFIENLYTMKLAA